MPDLPASLWLLLLTLAGAWFWRDSLRARELALETARFICLREGVQLLDGTVTLTRLGAGRDARGRLRLNRTYAFEYSRDGETRRHGFVRVAGTQADVSGL